MELNELLQNKIEEYEKNLAKVNKELESAPKGYIRVSYKHKCPQYYYLENRNERNGKYLNKNHQQLVKDIQLRDYNKKLKRELEHQLRSLRKCLATYSAEKLIQIYEQIPAPRKTKITPKIITSAEYKERWEATKYTPKPFNETQPFLITANGEKVRSKSENIIADSLLRLETAYRYEAPVRIAGITFHPDFICLNLRTRQEVLWEHLGLMDDADYATTAIEKIRLYEQSGYKLGENLILTAETREHPLNSQEVEQIINKYLK